MNATQENPIREISQYVRIPADDVYLLADLHVPEESNSLVVLANDGRCRNNPRSRHAARFLRNKGIGTLICDLLTDDEAGEDETAAEDQHDAALLAKRLIAVTRWLTSNPDTADLRIGYFGSCAGGAAVLIAADKMCDRVGAVVVRGGRLDLATSSLPNVTCPTLLLVGENDTTGIELNQAAVKLLTCRKELKLIPGASHLFGEPGKLDTICNLGGDWFKHHLGDPVHSG